MNYTQSKAKSYLSTYHPFILTPNQHPELKELIVLRETNQNLGRRHDGEQAFPQGPVLPVLGRIDFSWDGYQRVTDGESLFYHPSM